ncbi:hypothetical protein HQ32_00364 [Prauserella sp. Am3]|nr:hypothetical protein HQ32_00364 [Prauserella sp. Am3]
MTTVYVLVVVVLVVLPALAAWSSRRGRRRQDTAHAVVLEEFAAGLGGTVHRKRQAGAWSAHLKPPFDRQLAGFRRFLTTHRPRNEYAVEFARGPWRVRISDASLERRWLPPVPDDTIHERRVEIATADIAPLVLQVKQHTDVDGRPIDPDAGATAPPAPATVAARGGAWVETPVSAPANQHLAAFTGDHAAAARMVNAQATAWLLDRLHPMAPRIFTFESGLLYVTLPGRIDPAKDVETVNTLLGLLDCIPEASPTPPDGQSHLITEAVPTTRPEEKGSSMSTLGVVGIILGMLALVVGLFGYGGVNLVNGVASAFGLGDEVAVTVTDETEWNKRNPHLFGEYTIDGETHSMALSSGEVGEVLDGTMPVLPVSWLGIDDEPLTGWDPFWLLVISAVCFGLLAVPIWLVASSSSERPAATQGSTASRNPPGTRS